MGIELLIFLLLGSVIGLVAGLLGIGGGTVVVPALVFFLTSYSVDSELIMKIALGTSFATITITSLSSVYAHQRRGSVKWSLVFPIAFGAIIGVIFGSRVVSILSNDILQLVFAIFLIYTIYNMLRTASRLESDDALPIPKGVYAGAGGIIGFLSSFVGIGGGVMIVPFLNKVGYKMKNSIATSSAVGIFLALSGAGSAIFNGIGTENLPSNSLGFIYLPAFIGLSITSILCAPLGAKLVYVLPVKRIRQIFAGFLTIVLIIFIYNNYFA